MGMLVAVVVVERGYALPMIMMTLMRGLGTTTATATTILLLYHDDGLSFVDSSSSSLSLHGIQSTIHVKVDETAQISQMSLQLARSLARVGYLRSERRQVLWSLHELSKSHGRHQAG
ncbi:hypothetical protein SCHPADRAFT_672218 [Schizopora paradoxa]|uniref:Uncharacterized protein n=1 Tax=Schizopora paradoxa TaxID=27342 RepID=A0A0H2RBU9_9AGAM|nr:hypothetical protein SCHPADRAFT_672218 [Schizopora paradoxa]